MRTFLVRALDLDDHPVEKHVRAVDNMEAFALLEREGLSCIRLVEVPAGSEVPTEPQFVGPPPGEDEDRTPPWGSRRLPDPLPDPELAKRGTSPPARPFAPTVAPSRARVPPVAAVPTRPIPPAPRPTRALAPIAEPAMLEAVEAIAAPRQREMVMEEPATLQIWKVPEKLVDPRTRGMPPVDRLSFFSSAAAMTGVGIPLLRVVQTLEFVDPVSRSVMVHLARAMLQGRPLSAAMADLPLSFSNLQVGSVKGAEQSGSLPRVLARLHQHEERTLSMTRQVRAQMTYPLFVFSCALVLVMVVGRSLMTGMLPVVEQSRMQLTGMTGLAIAVAKALDNKGVIVLILAVLAALVWQARRWLRTPRGREALDRFLLKAPIVGGPLRKVEVGRMCEAIATLHQSGLTLLQCLDSARDSTSNVVMRQSLAVVMQDMKEGSSLSQALAATGFFDRTVVQLVYVGEESGNLGMAFTKIAQYNDLEVRTALEQFGAAVEPVMLLVLGFAVGTIALIAFAPLYQMAAAML